MGADGQNRGTWPEQGNTNCFGKVTCGEVRDHRREACTIGRLRLSIYTRLCGYGTSNLVPAVLETKKLLSTSQVSRKLLNRCLTQELSLCPTTDVVSTIPNGMAIAMLIN